MHNDIIGWNSIHWGLESWKPGSYRSPFLHNLTLLLLVFWNCLVAVDSLASLLRILWCLF